MNSCTKKITCCHLVNDSTCTLDSIVNCYINVHSKAKQAEIDPVKINKNTILKRIHYILTSVDENGKLHPHHKHLGKENLEKIAGSYVKYHGGRIKAGDSFETIHDILWDVLGPVSGLGKLYIYDMALRIGALFGCYPKDIYLHCGAAVGAKKLYDLSKSKGNTENIAKYFNKRGGLMKQGDSKYIKLSYTDFINQYPAFKVLQAYEIENILCTCNKAFVGAHIV